MSSFWTISSFNNVRNWKIDKILHQSWTKRLESSEKFQQDRMSLNLVQNLVEVYECRGRNHGSYPICLPKESLLKEKNILTVHKKTIHVGVTIAMSNIRTYHWIPSLRKITKSIIKKCHHCAWYRAIPFAISKPGLLSKRRNQECHPFQVIGVDYTGPIYYRSRNKAISKSYISLFWCSVSRAIYLELVPDLTNQEFIKSIKRLRARRWSSNIILTILFWRHSRLELSGLTELIKTKSLTIFWVLRV